jgi:hypothetical protein
MINNPALNNSNTQDDEIDIRQLFQIVWNGKLFIIAITTFFSIAAIFYSLSLPNIYQSKALLSPVGVETGRSNSSSSIGSLANLAGIDLSSGSGGKSEIAAQKIYTLSFFKESILPNIFLPDLMAISSWDAKSNAINYDNNLFNMETQTWINIPSTQKSYIAFMDKINFSKNDGTGIFTISIKHQSPHIAQIWIDLIVSELNDSFRKKDRREAQLAMNFLNIQMAQTNYTEIKQVIAQLLQQKIQQLSLIEANEFYVFSYLDPPMISEEPGEPNRRSISILGAILGFMLGLLLVIVQNYFIVTEEQ